jgi:hypothetical protein
VVWELHYLWCEDFLPQLHHFQYFWADLCLQNLSGCLILGRLLREMGGLDSAVWSQERPPCETQQGV